MVRGGKGGQKDTAHDNTVLSSAPGGRTVPMPTPVVSWKEGMTKGTLVSHSPNYSAMIHEPIERLSRKAPA